MVHVPTGFSLIIWPKDELISEVSAPPSSPQFSVKHDQGQSTGTSSNKDFRNFLEFLKEHPRGQFRGQNPENNDS